MLTDILAREVPEGEVLGDYAAEVYKNFINYSYILDNRHLIFATYDAVQNAVNQDLIDRGFYQLIGDYEDALKIARANYLMQIDDKQPSILSSLEL